MDEFLFERRNTWLARLDLQSQQISIIKIKEIMYGCYNACLLELNKIELLNNIQSFLTIDSKHKVCSYLSCLW